MATSFSRRRRIVEDVWQNLEEELWSDDPDTSDPLIGDFAEIEQTIRTPVNDLPPISNNHSINDIYSFIERTETVDTRHAFLGRPFIRLEQRLWIFFVPWTSTKDVL